MKHLPLSIALAWLSACGGSQHPASAAPDCQAVADHLLVLANADNQGEADPATASGIVAEFRQQCETGWSAERRRCLLGARTQEDTLACPTN